MRATRPGQSALLLLDAVEILRQEDVDYLVIGAFALSVHGVVRASRDADAVLSIAPGRLAELSARFERAGFATILRRGMQTTPFRPCSS